MAFAFGARTGVWTILMPAARNASSKEPLYLLVAASSSRPWESDGMRIGIIGVGRIGGNAARLFARAGHEVLLSFSRDADRLPALAAETGARTGTPREAVGFGEVVFLSVPWPVLDDVIAQAGPLDGKIVIDSTNQFGCEGWENLGLRTAAEVNAARMPGARYTKAFNTLTAGFQAQAAGRTGPDRVVMFMCGDDRTPSASSPA
jgi:predicted dinucleotide-binding enzyme